MMNMGGKRIPSTPDAEQSARSKKSAPKLTDAERHARFVDTARAAGASEDPKDFEKAFNRVISKDRVKG
ncbi:MAG: hypothetical protein ABSH33_18405 [Steroidobacteraceae bacterium]